MAKISMEADACPMKNEAYATAKHLNLVVHVVANQWMSMLDDLMVRLEVVDDGFDAADHWIVEKVGRTDVMDFCLLSNQILGFSGSSWNTSHHGQSQTNWTVWFSPIGSWRPFSYS